MDEPLVTWCETPARYAPLFEKFNTKMGITIVYVTHDQEEAMAWFQTRLPLWKMDHPTSRRPKELYHKPANEFRQPLLTCTNLNPAKTTKRATVLYRLQMAMPLPAKAWSSWAAFVSIRPGRKMNLEILKESFPIVLICGARKRTATRCA